MKKITFKIKQPKRKGERYKAYLDEPMLELVARTENELDDLVEKKVDELYEGKEKPEIIYSYDGFILEIEKAIYLENHKVWAKFNDGTSFEVDMKEAVDFVENLEKLKDIEMFKKFTVSHGAIRWGSEIILDAHMFKKRGLEQAKEKSLFQTVG